MPRRLLALFALAWAGFVAPCSLSHAAPAATVDPAGAPAPTGAAPATPSTTIVVYGDSLADGVWSGLRELTKTRPEVALIRHSQIGAGLTRPDFATWQSEVAKQAEADQATIAIVMFGLNDTTGLRDENHKGYQYKTSGWREAYEHRVDWLIQLLKARGAAVLWVGLPVFRKAETN